MSKRLAIDDVFLFIDKGWNHFITVICPLLALNADHLVLTTIKDLPFYESLFLELFEALFTPRQLFRQLIIVTAVQLILMGGRVLLDLKDSLLILLSKAEREQQQVQIELSEVTNYAQWMEVAERLDYLRGNDKWRLLDEGSLFDCNVLSKRINDTMEMCSQGDVFRLM